MVFNILLLLQCHHAEVLCAECRAAGNLSNMVDMCGTYNSENIFMQQHCIQLYNVNKDVGRY